MMACANLPGVQLIEGRAEAIPFPDASFDFLSMGYALRHIGDLSAAFSEFHRVLKPGGRLCLLEITKPERAWSQALLKVYMRGVVPVLARMIGSSAESAKLWRYYWDTIEACVPPSGVIDTLEAVGLYRGKPAYREPGAVDFGRVSGGQAGLSCRLLSVSVRFVIASEAKQSSRQISARSTLLSKWLNLRKACDRWPGVARRLVTFLVSPRKVTKRRRPRHPRNPENRACRVGGKELAPLLFVFRSERGSDTFAADPPGRLYFRRG